MHSIGQEVHSRRTKTIAYVNDYLSLVDMGSCGWLGPTNAWIFMYCILCIHNVSYVLAMYKNFLYV